MNRIPNLLRRLGLFAAMLAACAVHGAAGPAVFTDPSTNSGPEVNTTTGIAATLGSMDALDDTHRLAIGDHVSLRIIEDREDPKLLVVKEAGHLDVPYLGLFPAAGKTCRQLAREIKAELEKEYYYQATVIIAVEQLTRSRGRVYLFGAVASPGAQEIPGNEVLTVTRAIMGRGGFTEFADRRRVRITRQSESGTAEILTVDVTEILEKGRTDKDIVLKPGDMVYVRERFLNF